MDFAKTNLGVKRRALEGSAVDHMRHADTQEALQVLCCIDVSQPDLQSD